MKTKRTPFRQLPKNSDGAFDNRVAEAVVDQDEAPRQRGARREPAAAQAVEAPAKPKRQRMGPASGRANRGTVGRNGKPLLESKPERLQKVLAQAGIG